MLIGISESGVRLDPLACITKETVLDNSTAHHDHEFRITAQPTRRHFDTRRAVYACARLLCRRSPDSTRRSCGWKAGLEPALHDGSA